MSDEDRSADSGERKPKKLNLDALLLAKAAIATSVETLLVCHPQSCDWKYLDLDDPIELERVGVQQKFIAQQAKDAEAMQEAVMT